MPENNMRDVATRKKDVLDALEAQGHYWLVTAEVGGRPHVIGVSGWGDDGQIVVTGLGGSRTARNMAMEPQGQLAHGDPGDAIAIEAQMNDSASRHGSARLARGFEAAV